MDPYDTLGVSHDASMDVVRMAYLRAARLHHPDKLGHLNEQERSKHEAIFKEMTNAYSSIVEDKSKECDVAAATEAFMREWSAPMRPEEWEAIFKGVGRMFCKSDVMKDLFIKASALKEKWAAARRKADESDSTCDIIHRATLNVSAADVQGGKIRKVRLVLHDGAININVNCGIFPHSYRDKNVEIKLSVNEDEASEYEEGVWDLFQSVNVNLAEWFSGGVYKLKPLVAGGQSLEVEIPSCASLDSPICKFDLDFWKFGPIYVSVQLVLPTLDEWKSVKKTEQENILALLRDVVCKST